MDGGDLGADAADADAADDADADDDEADDDDADADDADEDDERRHKLTNPRPNPVDKEELDKPLTRRHMTLLKSTLNNTLKPARQTCLM